MGRRRRQIELAVEEARLEADEGDREEMLSLAALMDSLRAAWVPQLGRLT
jgi:hypothetical protein